MSQNNSRDDKVKIIEYFEKRLEQYGISPQTMGWRDKKQQYMRFCILAEIGNLNNHSVLDVGCGFGDFCDFLEKRKLKIQYSGYDISSKFIEIARKRHPDKIFKVKDILKENLRNKFDYVISSGICNLRISDNTNFLKKILVKSFELSKLGVAANMISNYVDYEDEDLYYYRSDEIFTFSKNLTKRVALRHDYMPFEFTIYLYKNNAIDKRNIFTQAFAEKKNTR